MGCKARSALGEDRREQEVECEYNIPSNKEELIARDYRRECGGYLIEQET